MRNGGRMIIAILGILLVFGILFGVIGLIWYSSSIGPVKKNAEDDEVVEVQIESGMYPNQIAELLDEKGAIKSATAMKLYVKLNGVHMFQSGNYHVKLNEDLKTVIDHMTKGETVSSDVRITFIEGKNMRWVAKTIAEKTNNTEQDVFDTLEDKDFIQELVDEYWFITDEVQDERIYYPLEGYLLPDTYDFESPDVSVKDIFKKILNYTDKFLTKYKDEIESNSLTTHQILTLASICELEGKSTEDRAEIIGVFYNRLVSKMPLGSDVTTYYAAKVDMSERNLTKAELEEENAYNTRNADMYGKIPVGPICNPSPSAIEATLHYKETDAYYFVADKNGKVYFTKNYEEHQAKIKELKKNDLWFTY